MIRVNDTQFAALESYFTEDFVERMGRILYSSFPEECRAKGRSAVLQFIRASMARARGPAIGVTLDEDFRRYVVTEFVLGINETAKIAASERARLLERDGSVDPTILVFCTYQAMSGKVMTQKPSQPAAFLHEATL
jgi:hypothetical protein